MKFPDNPRVLCPAPRDSRFRKIILKLISNKNFSCSWISRSEYEESLATDKHWQVLWTAVLRAVEPTLSEQCSSPSILPSDELYLTPTHPGKAKGFLPHLREFLVWVHVVEFRAKCLSTGEPREFCRVIWISLDLMQHSKPYLEAKNFSQVDLQSIGFKCTGFLGRSTNGSILNQFCLSR